MPHLAVYTAFNCAMRVGHWRGSPKSLLEDMQLLQPTMVPLVPRILNRIYD